MFKRTRLKVYTSIDSFHGVKNPVLTTGTFDGVHIGHKKIISRLKELAQQTQGETVLFTFYPHPRTVLFPDDTNLKLLNSQSEKIEQLERAGVDHLIIFPFTKEFSRLTAIEYVRDILVNKLHIHRLVLGYDHHFGRNREGSIDNLKELGPLYDFAVEEIPAEMVDEVSVSSTKIRQALLGGDMGTAKKFLGYDYKLTGLVVSGKQLGRSIGFPTANLKIIDQYKLIPGDGVYAVRVLLKKGTFFGMLNVGNKPTVNEELPAVKSVEVHIFNFTGELYNETLQVEFIEKIRNEEKFADINALQKQLHADKIKAEQVLQL